jgi:hypothetical protein
MDHKKEKHNRSNHSDYAHSPDVTPSLQILKRFIAYIGFSTLRPYRACSYNFSGHKRQMIATARKNEPARASIMVWKVLNIWIFELARTIRYDGLILLRTAPQRSTLHLHASQVLRRPFMVIWHSLRLDLVGVCLARQCRAQRSWPCSRNRCGITDWSRVRGVRCDHGVEDCVAGGEQVGADQPSWNALH